jgi:hypothetical protein
MTTSEQESHDLSSILEEDFIAIFNAEVGN